jgi:hypothetical protein
VGVIELEYRPFATKLEEYFLVNILHEEVKISKLGFKLALPITGWHSNMNYGKPKQYKDWLFDQGVNLIYKNKKAYLQFFDEQNATMFTIKWM